MDKTLWSTTAASNAGIDADISATEGQLAGTLNNDIRAIMAADARFRKDNTGEVVSTGAANTYAVTSNTAYASLTNGLTFAFRAHQTNSAASTFQINALTARSIVKNDGSALASGDIVSGGVYHLVYVLASTHWRIVNSQISTSSFQPLDASLTALAALTTAADKSIYFSGADTPVTFDFTSVGRTLVGQTTQALMRTTGLGMSANGSSLVSAADYAAMRGLLDLEAGTDFYSKTAADAAFQPLDSDLTAIAALSPSNDDIVQRKAGAWTNRTIAQLLTDLAAAGTTFQPLDSDLTSIAALSTQSFGRSLLTAASAQAAMALQKGVYILASSGAAVSVGATTSETVLATIAVPANAMGANGYLRITTQWTTTNSANNKTVKVRFGASGAGTGGTALGDRTWTTFATYTHTQVIRNRNATNSQLGQDPSLSGVGLTATAHSTAAIDTTAATEIAITGTKANSGETLTLEAYTVELLVP